MLLFAPPDQAKSDSIPALSVAGQATPLVLTTGLLHQLPHRHAAIPANEHEPASSFDGVPLRALLTRAGVPEGKAIRGEYLCWVVTVEAADGYKVVFTLAEIDPMFSPREVILADARDGKALRESEGPLRLVVPDEKRPARWIRQITHISVGPVCQSTKNPAAHEGHGGSAPGAGQR